MSRYVYENANPRVNGCVHLLVRLDAEDRSGRCHGLNQSLWEEQQEGGRVEMPAISALFSEFFAFIVRIIRITR